MSDQLQMMLLFAHALEEKLFDYTIDSYKAKALNVHTSLQELRFLAARIRKGDIPTGSLIPVVEEFESKILNDPVISNLSGSTFEVYVERISSQRKNPEALLDITDAVQQELDEVYWEEVKREIKKSVRKEKVSRKILSLADVFIAEAELHGVSREAIYHSAREYFWRKSIDNVEDINGFLKRFNLENKEYSFIFKASDTFEEVSDFISSFNIEILKNIPHKYELSYKAQDFFQEEQHLGQYIVVKSVNAKDPVSAREKSEDRIKNLLSVYSYHSHETDLQWSDLGICFNSPDQEVGTFRSQKNPIQKRSGIRVNDEPDDVYRTVDILTGEHFNFFGTRLFYKALDYHRAALEANTPENQLIDLWAALEGFLPSPDSSSKNRISHYVSVLLPPLTLGYCEKIFQYTSHALSHCRDEVVQCVRASSSDGDFTKKATRLVVCEDMQSERNELYSLLSENPLLRFRVFNLNNQFHSGAKAFSTIQDHKQRVSWHIQRIYQTRNQIMHSANSLPYINTLVENLHNYMDNLLNAIAIVGMKTSERRTMQGAIKLLSIHEQVYLRELKGGPECRSGNFESVIFGKSNPLSPYLDSMSI